MNLKGRGGRWRKNRTDLRSQNSGIQYDKTNTASRRGDSETRLLNLQRKGCEESLLSPAEALCQFLFSDLPFEATHPPFLPEREGRLHPSETPTRFALLTPSLPFLIVNGEHSHSAFGTSCVTVTGNPLPPLPSFGPGSPLAPLPVQWAQTPAAFKGTFPYREMQITKTKLLKKGTVLRLLPVFQGARPVPGHHGGWMGRGGAPARRVWLCASSKPQGCEGNRSLCTEDLSPSNSLTSPHSPFHSSFIWFFKTGAWQPNA